MVSIERILDLAGCRYGVFTRGEARALGISDRVLDRLVRTGTVIRAEPGVFRIAGAPVTWQQRVVIATLTEGGLASCRTAAALWGLDGCKPGIIEVLTLRWKRRPNRSVKVHETNFLPDEDRAEIDGIEVTSKVRTIVDLAAALPRHRVEMAMDTPGVDLEEVWVCCERLDSRGRPWVTVVRRLVAARLGRNGVTPNTFEKQLFKVLARAGVPLPIGQVEIRRADGTLIARVDWLYPDDKVILEADSFRWHNAWVRRKRDIRRDRELASLGYHVLRFSWEDVTEHEGQVAADVLGTLQAVSA